MKVMSQEDLTRLEAFITRSCAAGGMSLEEIDGFYTAFYCAPAGINPASYLPAMLGKADDGTFWGTTEELKELAQLLAQFSACKHSELHNTGAVKELLLRPDADGVVRGNEWASGFMRCIGLDSSSWLPLLSDVEHRGKLLSIMALAHENDSDPALRTFEETPSTEQREQLLASILEAIPVIYHFMQPVRDAQYRQTGRSIRRTAPKIGRNDPCPCGSGKKVKRCGCGFLGAS